MDHEFLTAEKMANQLIFLFALCNNFWMSFSLNFILLKVLNQSFLPVTELIQFLQKNGLNLIYSEYSDILLSFLHFVQSA